MTAVRKDLPSGRADDPTRVHGYAPVDGLSVYYEIEGTGDPLVYVPPAFGFAGQKSFRTLRERHTIVTVDLQGHGRTADVPTRALSIEQYARDVVGVVRHLGIAKADFLGESYGGATVIRIALQHPELVGRVATLGAVCRTSHCQPRACARRWPRPSSARSGTLRPEARTR
jgi:pimeloyl-ACP methyl ester carboxylesterase